MIQADQNHSWFHLSGIFMSLDQPLCAGISLLFFKPDLFPQKLHYISNQNTPFNNRATKKNRYKEKKRYSSARATVQYGRWSMGFNINIPHIAHHIKGYLKIRNYATPFIMVFFQSLLYVFNVLIRNYTEQSENIPKDDQKDKSTLHKKLQIFEPSQFDEIEQQNPICSSNMSQYDHKYCHKITKCRDTQDSTKNKQDDCHKQKNRNDSHVIANTKKQTTGHSTGISALQDLHNSMRGLCSGLTSSSMNRNLHIISRSCFLAGNDIIMRQG